MLWPIKVGPNTSGNVERRLCSLEQILKEALWKNLIGTLKKRAYQERNGSNQRFWKNWANVFEWLREHEYIMKTGSKYNEPTQKAMNRKLFHVVKDRFGNAITKMTQKGFIVLLNEIMDDYTGQNQMAII